MKISTQLEKDGVGMVLSGLRNGFYMLARESREAASNKQGNAADPLLRLADLQDDFARRIEDMRKEFERRASECLSPRG